MVILPEISMKIRMKLIFLQIFICILIPRKIPCNSHFFYSATRLIALPLLIAHLYLLCLDVQVHDIQDIFEIYDSVLNLFN